MKVRYLLIVCIFLSFFSIQSGLDKQCIALGAAWSSVITDTFQFRILGTVDVSEELYEIATEVFQFLQIKDAEKIQVKRMSSLLRSCVGNQNCIATHNALFVDEEWLWSLQEDERKFVLAHEAMHIKNKDTAKKMGAYLVLLVVSCTGIAYFKDKEHGIAAMGILGVIELAALAAYHRYQETRADAGADLVAPGAFHDDSGNDQQDPFFMQKIWLWLCSWFSEYHQDRFKKR